MAEDFYYGSGRHPQNREAALLRLLDLFMSCLTVLFAVAEVLTLTVPYVSPSRLGLLPVLALVAPLVYVGVVVIMLYWIIRWKWRRAGLMIALAAVGLLNVPRYYSPQLRRSYGDETYPRAALKVMSYNLRCFYSDDGQDYTVDSVTAFIGRFNPDIICFQEYVVPAVCGQERLDSLLGDYRKVVLGTVHPPLAIYSRFRILDSGRTTYLDADSMPRGKGLWADMVVGSDTVRVFNVHLNGTSISSGDIDYIVNYRYMSDTARNSKLYNIVKRLNANTVNRSRHVDALAEAVRETGRATILCGDFNDTPMSYAYHTLSRDMKDAFTECGRGYSHTFRGFFNLLRIDYALFDEEHFDILSYDAPDSVRWSDHLPVCVRAELRQDI